MDPMIEEYYVSTGKENLYQSVVNAYKIEEFLKTYLMIPLIIINIIGNAINIYIYSNKEFKKTSIAFLLCCLSIADVLNAYTLLYSYFNINNTIMDVKVGDKVFKSYSYIRVLFYIYTVIPLFTPAISALVAVDRYITVNYPKMIIKLKSRRNQLIVIGPLLLLFLLMNIATFFEVILIANIVAPYYTSINSFATNYTKYIYPYLNIALASILSFLIMCVCNIITLIRLRKLKKKMNRPTNDTNRFIAISITLNVLFLIFYLPRYVIECYRVYYDNMVNDELPSNASIDKNLEQIFISSKPEILVYELPETVLLNLLKDISSFFVVKINETSFNYVFDIVKLAFVVFDVEWKFKFMFPIKAKSSNINIVHRMIVAHNYIFAFGSNHEIYKLDFYGKVLKTYNSRNVDDGKYDMGYYNKTDNCLYAGSSFSDELNFTVFSMNLVKLEYQYVFNNLSTNTKFLSFFNNKLYFLDNNKISVFYNQKLIKIIIIKKWEGYMNAFTVDDYGNIAFDFAGNVNLILKNRFKVLKLFLINDSILHIGFDARNKFVIVKGKFFYSTMHSQIVVFD